MHPCVSTTLVASPRTRRIRFLLVLGILVLTTQLGIAEDTTRDLTVLLDDIAIAHVADGEGWSSTITLVNLDSVDAAFELLFAGNNGLDLPFPFQGFGNQERLTGTIPLRGSVTFQTAGTSATVTEGWAFVLSNQRIGGMAVFSFRRPGLLDFEAVVPFSSIFDLRQVLAFDHQNGFRTGLALANTSTTPFAVTMQFRGENGIALFSDVVNLPSVGHTSFLLSDRYPALNGIRGTVEFSGPAGLQVSLAVLGLRVNPQGPITTIFPMRAPNW